MEDKLNWKRSGKKPWLQTAAQSVLQAGVILVYNASRSSKPKFCAAEGMWGWACIQTFTFSKYDKADLAIIMMHTGVCFTPLTESLIKSNSNKHHRSKCACGSWKPNKVKLPNSITQATRRLFNALWCLLILDHPYSLAAFLFWAAIRDLLPSRWFLFLWVRRDLHESHLLEKYSKRKKKQFLNCSFSAVWVNHF